MQLVCKSDEERYQLMNDRIKELAKKAGFPEWTDKTIGFELEQFASGKISMIFTLDCYKTWVKN